MLQIIEADDAVEGPVFERQPGHAHLDEVRAEESLARFKVREVEVRADPGPAFLPQEIAQDALGAAEVEADVCRGDGQPVADEVDLFFFLQGFLRDLKLPGRRVHGVDYSRIPAS